MTRPNLIRRMVRWVVAELERGVETGVEHGVERVVERGVEPGVVLCFAPVVACVFVRDAARAVRRTGARLRSGGRGGTNGFVAKERTTPW